MKSKLRLLIPLALLIVVTAAGATAWLREPAAEQMTGSAQAFIESLDEQQRAQAVMPFDGKERLAWHFIPKPERKGLQIKDMTAPQRQHAHALLSAALSQVGYDKATTIMELEAILHALEKGRPGAPIRDPERYYFTLFGEPADDAKWGLSVEGHHLSLNFVVERDKIVSHTPAFFGANPAIVRSDVGVGPKRGTRVLAREETLAFDLVTSLSPQQRQVAIIDETAPPDLRAAGEPQPPQTEPEGIRVDDLNDEQTHLLRELIKTYASNMPPEIAHRRLQEIDDADFDNIHFAWAGALEPGIGHYYRVQGPTFLIEFVNTQPDSEGNPANHIHSVWRDMQGDFAIAIDDHDHDHDDHD